MQNTERENVKCESCERLRAALKPFADIDGLGVTARGHIEIKIPGAILIAARAALEQPTSGEVK